VLLNGINRVDVSDVGDVDDGVREVVHAQARVKASGHVLWWLWLDGK